MCDDSLILMLSLAIKTSPRRTQCWVNARYGLLDTHTIEKEQKVLWKDTTLRFLQELMVQQNYCVCIYLEINTFTGQGANGSETNLRTREACYLFPRTWKGAHYWTVMKELLLVWNPSGDHILMQYAYSLVKLLRFQRCYEKTSLLGCLLFPVFLLLHDSWVGKTSDRVITHLIWMLSRWAEIVNGKNTGCCTPGRDQAMWSN